MKLSEAEKVAMVIDCVQDPHGSVTATRKIIEDLCYGLNSEFPEFVFKRSESGRVKVLKKGSQQIV